MLQFVQLGKLVVDPGIKMPEGAERGHEVDVQLGAARVELQNFFARERVGPAPDFRVQGVGVGVLDV